MQCIIRVLCGGGLCLHFFNQETLSLEPLSPGSSGPDGPQLCLAWPAVNGVEARRAGAYDFNSGRSPNSLVVG